MKQILLVLFLFLGISCVNAQKNSMKVVVTDDGSLVGRYVRQTDTTYIANPLDWEVEVSKKSSRVEIWTPEKGKGFVVRKDRVRGNINVRKQPSIKSAIIDKITEADGQKDYPDCFFDCLGKTGEWFKISIRGKEGYVREDLVDWAAYFAD